MFGMGTGGSPSLQSPKNRRPLVRNQRPSTLQNIDGRHTLLLQHTLLHTPSVPTVKFYGQAERAISNGKLNALLRLHIRPIDVVVFHGPS